jgi:hypothetical protein
VSVSGATQLETGEISAGYYGVDSLMPSTPALVVEIHAALVVRLVVGSAYGANSGWDCQDHAQPLGSVDMTPMGSCFAGVPCAASTLR